jgi:hypothetical protein
MNALLEVKDITLSPRGPRPRTPPSPGELALAPSTGDVQRSRM